LQRRSSDITLALTNRRYTPQAKVFPLFSESAAADA
jgi:hypothetical protein